VQTGKPKTGGEGLRVVSIRGGVFPPSKLYSFLQLAINNRNTITCNHSTFFITSFLTHCRMND
jgi:hypothetical protein